MLKRPDATPQPHHPSFQRQAMVDIMRGHAADVVGAQVWSNSKYAGQTYDKLPPKMQERYPDGVDFSYEGFPQFDRYAAKTVIFEEGFRGPTREDDFKRANAIFGWSDEPKGMTWHHAEDGKTMLLIDTKLHAIGHWGGVRVSKQMGLSEGQD